MPRLIHLNGPSRVGKSTRARRYANEHPDRYAEAKRDAAALWADDRLAYTDAKTEAILSILEEFAHRRIR